jgi:uncharacterized membrane-anchored protein YitT (DUF2179 family)
VLHTVLLILAGLVLTGILSAEFEMLVMRNHPYLSKLLAGTCVILAAYTHSWMRLLIAMGVIFVYVGVRRDFQLRAERKNKSSTADSQP